MLMLLSARMRGVGCCLLLARSKFFVLFCAPTPSRCAVQSRVLTRSRKRVGTPLAVKMIPLGHIFFLILDYLNFVRLCKCHTKIELSACRLQIQARLFFTVSSLRPITPITSSSSTLAHYIYNKSLVTESDTLSNKERVTLSIKKKKT